MMELFDSKPFHRDFMMNQYNNQNRMLISQSMKNIPQAKPGQTALVLAAELADRDLILLLEKGYFVIAVDTWLINFELMITDSVYEKYKTQLRIINGWDRLNFDEIPTIDIVMASFVLPLFDKEGFNSLWNDINKKLKPGGYFIGNFFDPSFFIFKKYNKNQTETPKKKKTLHTKNEVEALLNEYDNVQIIEVNNAAQQKEKPTQIEFYYDVFAKKKS